MIWLLRHGDAEEGDDDDARRLTEKGRHQSGVAGQAMAGMGIELDACLSSPKARAVETAKLACEPLGLEVETTDALAGGDFDPLDLTAGRGDVLMVGHEPDFSNAIAAVTGGKVDMKKGGLAGLDGSTLVTLLRPDQLAAIAR